MIETAASFEYVQKKAEKIAAALYLVTNLLSDREPLKWALRGRAVSLSGDIFRLEKHASRVLPHIQALTTEILSLLEIAVSARLVSDMNVSILKGAFLDLQKVLEEREAPFQIAQGFLDVPRMHLKNGDSFSKRTLQPSMRSTFGHISDMTRPEFRKSVKDTLGQDESSVRRKKILSAMQSIKSGTISDIVRIAPEVSEKTIQRDLSVLVNEGHLEKRGRKRWVTYHIKSDS